MRDYIRFIFANKTIAVRVEDIESYDVGERKDVWQGIYGYKRKGDFLNIGYACIALGVLGTDLKSCTIKNVTGKRLRKLIEHNLIVLNRMLDYNNKNNIKLFRISANIVPFASHPVNQIRWWEEFGYELKILGEKIRGSNMRVSIHPGQYIVLNSPREDVVKTAFSELEYHGKFLDSLGVDSTNKIILHLGGVYGDKKVAIKRFEERYADLPDNVKYRLVIENDERCYNISDVLELGIKLGIPVVYDSLHNEINPACIVVDDYEWIRECAKTWSKEDGVQKIHYSNQDISGRPGAHSPTIYIDRFMDFYEKIRGIDLDIMLEVKDKNLSALKCINCTNENLNIEILEEEWDKYKYFILGKSVSVYNNIGTLLKDKKKVNPVNFYKEIERSLEISENREAEKNAAFQIWGYFKNRASDSEKNKWERLIQGYMNGNMKLSRVKSYLFKLSLKYNIEYLYKSYYFFL